MKTILTVLTFSLSVIAAYFLGYGLLNQSIPIVELLEYGVGTTVAAGILAMCFMRPRQSLRQSNPAGAAAGRVTARSRRSHFGIRHNLPHAA